MKFRAFTVLWTGLLFLFLAACYGKTASQAPASNSVTVLGTLTGKGIQEIQTVVAPFSDRTGIHIDYQGTDAFTTLLPLNVAAGNPPDIALFPQPGLMKDLVAQHALIPLESLVDPKLLADALTDQWQALGKIGDQTYGLPLRAYLKGLIWYRPDRFQEKGYSIPQTWEALQALTQKMIANGETPWCLGIESGEATGWAGTDWVEDILLRQSGENIYDRWVNHQIPFSDPHVEQAFRTFGSIALNNKAVQGGRVAVLSTSFTDSPKGLFQTPPTCNLHDQSNFITAFFPPNVNLNKDVDFFLMPKFAADPSPKTRIVVGAVQLGVLRDTPAVRRFLNYLLTPEPQRIWAGLGGHLSPYRQVDESAYPDSLSRKEAKIIQTADVIRFDGSDSMPSAVGTGSFWSGIVDYVSGVDLKTVLHNIDNSWPKSKGSQEAPSPAR